MSVSLSARTLASVADRLPTPSYDRGRLAHGVVHIGPLDGLPVCYPQLVRGLCRLLPGPDATRLTAASAGPSR